MSNEIYFYREGLVQSILSDTYTLGLIGGTVWFNQTYCGGSYFLNALLLVIFVLSIIGKSHTKKKTFTSREKLIEHLRREAQA